MLIQGEHYNFTVIKILDRGAVGTIDGETRTGFVHISCISDSFVQNVSDYIRVGETYDAVCQDAEKFGFSLKHMNLQKQSGENIQSFVRKPECHRTESTGQKKPYSKPKAATTIDEMIAKADASLKDKQKHKSMSQARPRRGHKPNNFDGD